MRRYGIIIGASIVLIAGFIVGFSKKGAFSFLVNRRGIDPDLACQKVDNLGTGMSLADVEELFGTPREVSDKRCDRDGDCTFTAWWGDKPKDLENIFFSNGYYLMVNFKNEKIAVVRGIAIDFKGTMHRFNKQEHYERHIGDV
jgi:hypothetical protein